MPLLLSPNIVRQRLFDNEQASDITIPYRLWSFYKDAVPASVRTRSHHEAINRSLDVIEGINAWHPEWLTNWIDFDLDLYTTCTRQSRALVHALNALQDNPNVHNRRTYIDARVNLEMLARLAERVNEEHALSQWLLIGSALAMVFVSFVFPAYFIPALIASLFLIPIALLVVLQVVLTGSIDFWFDPSLFSLVNLVILAAMCAGIVGLVMNVYNPSPQGSVQCSNAMDDLVRECEEQYNAVLLASPRPLG